MEPRRIGPIRAPPIEWSHTVCGLGLFRPGARGRHTCHVGSRVVDRRKIASSCRRTGRGWLVCGVGDFGAIDDQASRSSPPAPGTAAETVVWISVFNAARFGRPSGRLLNDMSVTLHPAVQQNPLTFARGVRSARRPCNWSRTNFSTVAVRRVPDPQSDRRSGRRQNPERSIDAQLSGGMVTGAVAEWR